MSLWRHSENIMKAEKFKSFDGTVLQCYLWDNVRNPKAVVQISHGMAEHARRYDDFANYLNQNGFIVFADDHRAHGMTSTKQSAKGVKGYHKGDIYFDTMQDECAITSMLKERYNLPVIYLGHSYGSMLGQRYIQECKDYTGAVLCGSAMMKGAILNMGAAISNLQYKTLGGEKTGKMLDKLSFGSYNAPFKSEKTPFAWLSRDKEQVKNTSLTINAATSCPLLSSSSSLTVSKRPTRKKTLPRSTLQSRLRFSRVRKTPWAAKANLSKNCMINTKISA